MNEEDQTEEPDEDEQVPYCRECGSESLAYLEAYADGEEWLCRDCGTVFQW